MSFRSVSIFALLFAALNVSAGIDAAIEEQERIDATRLSNLCGFLSKEACSLLSPSLVGEADVALLTGEDRALLEEVLSVTPVDMETKSDVIPDSRLAHLRQAGMTWGVQIGMAAEASRFNRLWEKQSALLDRAVNFETLMVEYGAGRSIIPPVVLRLEDSQRVDAGGRTFRVAGVVYRILEQPRFSVEPPSWREYLKFQITRPDAPVSSLMPQSSSEAEYWRNMVVRGFLQGVKTTRQRVDARYRKLRRDYIGMVTYHILRQYEMISSPVIDLQQTPVIANKDGSMMAIDDTVAVLSVTPRLNSRRNMWSLYPQLKELSKVQKESISSALQGDMSW